MRTIGFLASLALLAAVVFNFGYVPSIETLIYGEKLKAAENSGFLKRSTASDEYILIQGASNEEVSTVANWMGKTPWKRVETVYVKNRLVATITHESKYTNCTPSYWDSCEGKPKVNVAAMTLANGVQHSVPLSNMDDGPNQITCYIERK